MLPLITVFSFCTAFLRDVLLARSLGAGPISDYLWLALLLPAVFENVAGIPLRDAVIARLSGRVGRDLPRRLVFVPIVVAMGGITAPLWLASTSVVAMLAPGWTDDLVEAAVPLFAMGLLLLPVHAAYYVLTALASVKNRFAWSHARSLVLNAGVIGGCLLWPGEVAPVLGAMLLAAIGHSVVLRFQAIASPAGSESPSVPLREPDARGMALLSSFVFLAVMQQTCVLLERVFASELSGGAITCLSVAYRLATIPLAVGVGSLIVPYYVRLEANRDAAPGKFINVLYPMVQGMFWFVLPAAAVMWSCSREITELLFVRGAFTAADGERAAAALSMYAWGLPFFSTVLLLGRALFARRLLKATLVSSLVTTVIYGVGGFSLRANLSIGELAALMSFAAGVQSLCFVAVLGGHLGWREIQANVKAGGFGVQLGLVAALALMLQWCPLRSWPVLATLGIVWGAAYGALTWRSVPFLSASLNRRSRRQS